jgi:tellurite resistance protein TehA-like permease
MAGLALGIASLGVCLQSLGVYHVIQHVAAAIAAIMLLSIFAKFIYHRQLLKQDLAHPVVGSVVPTSAMALMVVSAAVAEFHYATGVILWFIAIALHLIFLTAFSIHRLRDFKIHHMVPSWFVPPVGIIVAAVTYPHHAAAHMNRLFPLAEILLFFGIIAYAIMLPMMIYRFMFEQQVVDAAKPSLAIMAAPASLSLAGYLTLYPLNPNPLMIAVLAGIAVLMTVLIYISLLHLLSLPFSPAFSAYTFPMVISSTAMFKTAAWMKSETLLSPHANWVSHFAVFEALVATAVVSYIGIRYLMSLWHYLTHLRGSKKS